MKILVIPDVHGRTFWKGAVENFAEGCDKIIFLGDYIDPYKDEDITRKQAIAILEEVIDLRVNNPEKVVLLIGNHDAHYMLRNFPRSTRYDSSNSYKIKEIYASHKSLFKLAHEETVNGKRILFTHAGLMNSWVERNKPIVGDTSADSLNRLLDVPGGITALSDISNYRTWLGEETGSILWSDIMEKADVDLEKNITPNDDSVAEGYDYQVFGHTFLKNEIITDKWACLDCRKAFIINENGDLNVA